MGTPRDPAGTITFLFTDIEGSTVSWDQRGEAMAVAQARHDALLRAAIAAEDGVVISTAGDGVGAAFTSAAAGVRAALAAQRALADEPWPGELEVRVRMGLHSGPARQRDGDYFGVSVIRAARLMGLVDGGRVVCSTRTAQLVADDLPAGYEWVTVGWARLKGLTEPEHVLAVRGPGLQETGAPVTATSTIGRGAPKPATPTLGRDDLTAEVSARLGGAPVVTLVGPGGVGKTRVAQEVARGAEATWADGVAWVELAPVATGAEVVQAVADVIGARAQPGASLLDAVIGVLSGRRVASDR